MSPNSPYETFISLQVTTELCLFHRRDCPTVVIRVGGIDIRSGPIMNVLGITFDSKLQWSQQISNMIKKSISALHAINLIPLGGEAYQQFGIGVGWHYDHDL